MKDVSYYSEYRKDIESNELCSISIWVEMCVLLEIHLLKWEDNDKAEEVLITDS